MIDNHDDYNDAAAADDDGGGIGVSQKLRPKTYNLRP